LKTPAEKSFFALTPAEKSITPDEKWHPSTNLEKYVPMFQCSKFQDIGLTHKVAIVELA
jgi:hypothetical protein